MSNEIVDGIVMEVKQPNPYLSVFIDLIPLFGLAFSMCVLRGLHGIKDSYLGKSFMARFTNIILSSAFCAILAIACALILPLAGFSSDPQVMLGVVVFVAACGLRIVDSVIYKALGLHIVDPAMFSRAERAWHALSPDEREECIKLWKEHKKHHIEEDDE